MLSSSDQFLDRHRLERLSLLGHQLVDAASILADARSKTNDLRPVALVAVAGCLAFAHERCVALLENGDFRAEFQEMFPSGDDPTGVRVKFANLPYAKNTINIYTLSGDLVETIEHDGTEGYGEASWNLISRNGQEVVSGIYMYVVQSEDGAFEDFIGKFVVVR